MLKLKRDKTVKYEMVNIREFFKKSNKLMIFLPEDKLESFQLVEQLQNWLENFAEVIYFAPKFQVNFLRKLKQCKLVNISDINIANCKHQDAVILYLNDTEPAGKYLADTKNSLILAAENSQLNFSPEAETRLKYLEKVAAFIGLENRKEDLNLTINNSDVDSDMMMRNKFPNFVLHVTELKDRDLKNLVMSLKNKFSANIHFSAKSCKLKDIPNIKVLPELDLLQLYSYAKSGEIIITDDSVLQRLLKYLDINSILIDEIKDLTNLNARINSRLNGIS